MDIFKVLSDDTRLRIILLLAQDELCVCELTSILDSSQPKVSKNLSKLRDMNLVIDERKEKFVFYKLTTENAVLINTIKNILDNIEEYPQLILDRSRLADKEKYLAQCSLNTSKD